MSNYPESALAEETQQRADLDRINSYIELQAEETLHLEFKTLSSDEVLNREDRKMLAKAICGLSNAEGGRLVVGIETKKADRIDVAFAKKPIKGLDRYRRFFTAGLPEMLSPQHNGISSRAVRDHAAEDQGYLIVDVPPSQDRPHMSVPEKRYFRRGSDGTRVLDHGEVRELMFASREGRLEIQTDLRVNSFVGDLRYSLVLILTLRNSGKVPIIAPYLRLKDSAWINEVGLRGIERRTGAGTTVGFYGSRDLLIHVDDESGVASITTGLDFRGTGQRDIRSAVLLLRAPELQHAFRMIPFSEMGRAFAGSDRTIRLGGVFGAENAIAQAFDFHIGKEELLTLFCADPGISSQISS